MQRLLLLGVPGGRRNRNLALPLDLSRADVTLAHANITLDLLVAPLQEPVPPVAPTSAFTSEFTPEFF